MFPDITQHPALRGFEVLGRLGAGSTGQVFLAKSRAGRLVAIKILREPKDGDEEQLEGLAREATLCVRLNHPAIVQVRAFVEEAGLAALIFDYVEGPPLARLMRLAAVVGARLPDRVAWHIVERILAALTYAHLQRDDSGGLAPIVHRDISPSNVLVDWTGDVKITDFGIAKMLGVSPATRYGLVKGTMGCMAPEQARGEPVDERADVYAAGLLAWRLATGRLPFDPRMVEAELLRAMRYPKIRPLSALRADLPAELVNAVDVALSPELTQRTIGANELHTIVARSMDVERGRAELSELLDRWRAQLERVKSPRDSNPGGTDSSGDKKFPTLRYEQVDGLEEDYAAESPTLESLALRGDDAAWAAGAVGAVPSSSNRAALPVMTIPPPSPALAPSPPPASTAAPGPVARRDVEVMKLPPLSLPTPISISRAAPVLRRKRNQAMWGAILVIAAVVGAAVAWILKHGR